MSRAPDVADAAAALLLAITKALPLLSHHAEGADVARRNVLDAMEATSKALAPCRVPVGIPDEATASPMGGASCGVHGHARRQHGVE